MLKVIFNKALKTFSKNLSLDINLLWVKVKLVALLLVILVLITVNTKTPNKYLSTLIGISTIIPILGRGLQLLLLRNSSGTSLPGGPVLKNAGNEGLIPG